MPFKASTKLLCLIFALLALCSCGDSKAGGSGEFATVFIEPNSATFSDKSTFLTLTAATTNPVPVSLALTSTAYPVSSSSPGNNISPSAVNIVKTTVTLTPADTVSPPLPALAQTQFQPVTPSTLVVGANPLTVPIEIDSMLTFLQGALASGSSASYFVSIALDGVEVTSNRSGHINFPAALKIKYTKP